ncbi:277_t:CDS:2 [Ambispora gerdemannii]|uniref:277_t:CDS:1 n=1 Tax=Ambispora gerdemannii TaxID=144530 RepID=A0A9N9B6K9_9GLOM|nr:277_t:CDS:2 [Ambispora gerdemannii]
MKLPLALVDNLYKKSVVTIVQRKNFSMSRWYAAPLGSHVSNNDPKILEEEEEKLSKGKVKSKIITAPGWNEVLASESEAIVKAERGGNDISVKELQHHTIKILHDEKDYSDNLDFEETITKERNNASPTATRDSISYMRTTVEKGTVRYTSSFNAISDLPHVSYKNAALIRQKSISRPSRVHNFFLDPPMSPLEYCKASYYILFTESLYNLWSITFPVKTAISFNLRVRRIHSSNCIINRNLRKWRV